MINHVNSVKNAVVAQIKIFANDKPIPDNSIELVKLCMKIFHNFETKIGDKCPKDFIEFLGKLKK